MKMHTQSLILLALCLAAPPVFAQIAVVPADDQGDVGDVEGRLLPLRRHVQAVAVETELGRGRRAVARGGGSGNRLGGGRDVGKAVGGQVHYRHGVALAGKVAVDLPEKDRRGVQAGNNQDRRMKNR